MSRVVFTQEKVSEHLWLLYYDLPKNAPIVHGVRLPLIVTFVVSAVSSVSLGQIVGRQLDLFRERGASLAGYAGDLADAWSPYYALRKIDLPAGDGRSPTH
jgi:hypothetical protein